MRFVAMTDKSGATLEVVFGGQNESRPTEMVDVDEFIGIKSHRAKGKRITTYEVSTLRFIEPEEPEEPEVEDIEDVDAGVEDMELDNEIDVEDIMGGEIKADPTVDYRQKDEQEGGFTASQLDLF